MSKRIQPGPRNNFGRSQGTLSPQDTQTLNDLFKRGDFVALAEYSQQLTRRLPRHPLGWKALGIALKQIGRDAEALDPMQRAANLAPTDAESHNNLGVLQRDLGHLSEARKSLERAARIKPDYAEAHANLGITLRDLGYLTEAESSCRRALAINPHQIDALSNLGTVLRDSGRLDEAESILREALRHQPASHEIHHNLGILLGDQIRLEEAEACFIEAMRIKPDFVEALHGFARLRLARNDPFSALNAIIESLQIRATAEAKRLFVDCVKPLRFSEDNPDMRQILICALNEPWGRPSDLAGVCTSLIMSGADVDGSDPLLCALLTATQINDIELERFLTAARRSLLSRTLAPSADAMAKEGDLAFCAALAQQCFINEYVFAVEENEARFVDELASRVAKVLVSGEPLTAQEWLVLAAYRPLHSLPDAPVLLERPWPPEAEAVLIQQIREPEEEAQTLSTIRRLTAIDDRISQSVRQQYEESPYPRWIRTAPAGQARNAVAALRAKFPLANFSAQTNPGTDILIAGCGTGQQSIEVAMHSLGARILAVDLSLSSLAYAQRKSREAGLGAIDYAQADILQLGSLEQRFDIIESAGVLHHLADPWTGWRILLSLLRPGGLMRIGLYSSLARRHITRIRQWIGPSDTGTSPTDIRRIRQGLIARNSNEDFGGTLQMTDFFSTSACRDLLFHVQEHCFTLADISAFISEEQLGFIGFDLDPQIIQAYRRRFPDDPAATDLAHWQCFEDENPDTFVAMYQFWVQKR